MKQLSVHLGGRFLQDEKGAPFFYLGDTAWELFHRCDESAAQRYLASRAALGFTVIQAVALAELRGLQTPNPSGHLPFLDGDPERPNENYFRHVDYVVKLANELGLLIGLLPCWGSFVKDAPWEAKGDSRVIFNEARARSYGEFLGRRYREAGLIWILGGDRPGDGVEAVWGAMAAGLKAGDGGTHLITWHPVGQGSSSTWLHDASWLDFNMIQSGHFRRFNNNYDMIKADWERQPVKPTLDGEPCYEYHYVGFNGLNGLFDDYDVRVALYRSVFAGGCGVTYGCGPLWQMWTPASEYPSALAAPSTPWPDVLNLPGARQVRHLKRLMLSRSYFNRFPEDRSTPSWNLFDSKFKAGTASTYVTMTRDGTPGRNDATYLMAYLPQVMHITIDTTCLAGKHLRYWWFDPRQGLAHPNPIVDNTGRLTPAWHWLPWQVKNEGLDWVLVVDDASAGYPAPGSGCKC